MPLADKLLKLTTSLKTEASKLKPKPDDKFFNGLKGGRAGELKVAALQIDGIIAGKVKDVEPKLATKTFKDKRVGFFQFMVLQALPEGISEALTKKIKAAETALINEAKVYIKKMGVEEEEEGVEDGKKEEKKGESESVEVRAEKAMAALKKFAENREQGIKEVEQFVKSCQLFLVTAKDNRKLGRDMLLVNRKLGEQILINEQKFSNESTFFKGRNSVDTTTNSAIEEGICPEKEVSEYRSRASKAFELGMRLMAKARDLRNQILAEIQGHELDADKQDFALHTDESRLKKLGEIMPEVTAILDNKILFKTKVERWGAIQDLTSQGIKLMKETRKDESLGYRTKRDEGIEAFEALPAFRDKVNLVSSRVVLLMTGNASEAVKTKVSLVVRQLTPIRSEIKLCDKRSTDFGNLCKLCDMAWEKAFEMLKIK